MSLSSLQDPGPEARVYPSTPVEEGDRIRLITHWPLKDSTQKRCPSRPSYISLLVANPTATPNIQERVDVQSCHGLGI